MTEEARFADVYIERVDKESEEMIQTENASFLNTTLTYVKNNKKNSFISSRSGLMW